MQIDAPKHPTWTAMLPGGRRTRLRLARGVRLCVGDVLRVGRRLYRVVERARGDDPAIHEFVVVLAPER